mmetsp:Transcript_22318/g.88593  ORF Transcript_22318/g.88593 Transcript_22318/m.88593 type:complete len:481 (-) Transcript_22318:39-1481(-)
MLMDAAPQHERRRRRHRVVVRTEEEERAVAHATSHVVKHQARSSSSSEADVTLDDGDVVEGLRGGLARLLVGFLGFLVVRLDVGAVAARGDLGGLGLLARLDGAHLRGAVHGVVRVELEHGVEVLERVLLGPVRALGVAALGGPHDRLDLVRVDDRREVGVGHDGLRQREVLLERGRQAGRLAVERVELGERLGRPHDEAPDVAARREQQQVEPVDAAQVDAGQVAARVRDLVLGVAVVDDERPAAQRVAPVPHLALARAQLLRGPRVLDVGRRAHRRKHRERLLGLLDDLRRGGLVVVARTVGDDERQLGHLVDLVAARRDERRHRRRRERRRHGVAALLEVDLAVPLAPRLGGGEHAPAAAHVAEGTLPRALRAAALDARNPRHGAPRAPRLGRRLVPRLHRHGVRLARVLGHVRVDELHEVGPDRRREHARHRRRRHGGPVDAEDRHARLILLGGHRARRASFEPLGGGGLPRDGDR